MPKNKKPAGGRPAKNFDPSYAKGGSKGGPARAGSAKPGSRSEGHRGYRPEPTDAPRKVRWSADERVASGRTPHRGDRDGRDAGQSSERPARSYDRNDRPARSYDRDDRARRARTTGTTATTATTARPVRTTATIALPARRTAKIAPRVLSTVTTAHLA